MTTTATTAPDTTATEAKPRRAVEVVQRVILPRRGEPHDVRLLYISQPATNFERLRWSNRTSLAMPAGTEVSFETYFNAFPASYWARWSQLGSVVLSLEISGAVQIAVYRSTYNGKRVAIGNYSLETGHHEIDIRLDHFEDGGLLWFDAAAEEDSEISDAAWCAPQAPGPQRLPDGSTIEPAEKKVAIGIPTFNRPADAVKALAALGEDPAITDLIDVVLMPDQGTVHPADEPDYAEAVAPLGERLREFRQGNLGGSGGYSRIMYEALNNTQAPFVLFMDDDIAIEPDSIMRAVQAARFAATPIIVGGQMLNLQDRAQLWTTGERVRRDIFMWGPANNAVYEHDFSRYSLRDIGTRQSHLDPTQYDSRALHRRIDSEFNGWWMCLFPRVVAEQIGLPLPLFIKWDDAEYALRAGAHGFATVTWPGAAIWHMAWADKDDSIDWQAYFHLRNRLIVAAMYHDGDPRGLIRSIFKTAMKNAMCMEYSTMALHIEALKDFLAGPEQLFDILDSALPKVAEIRKNYDDAIILPSARDLPDPSGAPGVPVKTYAVPQRNPNTPVRTLPEEIKRLGKIPLAVKGLLHSLRRENREHWHTPQLNLTAEEARWFTLTRVDSATVATAGGTGVAFRRRNRDLALSFLRQTHRLLDEVFDNFEELRDEYRAALPQLSAQESWKKVFDAQ